MTAPTLPPADATPVEPGPGRWHRVRSMRPPAVTVTQTPWMLGVLGAAWAAVIGLGLAVLPMLMVWMTNAESGLGWPDSLRLGGLLWLVANGAALTVAGVTYSLLPWGLALVPLALLGYAGGWAARRADTGDLRGVARLSVPGAVVYAVIAALVAELSARPEASVGWPSAALWAFLLALIAMCFGAVRASGLITSEVRGHPVAVVMRAGAVGALALIGMGAVAATVSLLVHIDDAVTMAQSLSAGLLGGLALLAFGASFVPVMAMWGAAYVMGAGVVIGPSITASPFIAAGAPTQFPPFPLLAALPQGAPALAWLLPLTGVLAGVLAGLVIARGAITESRLVRLGYAGGAAVFSGLLLAAGAWLASGSLGDLRLAQLGPVPMTVGILGAVLVAIGAVPSAVAPAPPARARLSVADGDIIDASDPGTT